MTMEKKWKMENFKNGTVDFPKGKRIRKQKTPSICLTFICGERGIRTPGASQHGSFQDYCNRPLYHLSNARLSRKRVQRYKDKLRIEN